MKHLQVIRGRVRVAINVLENVTKCYLYSADSAGRQNSGGLGGEAPLGSAPQAIFCLLINYRGLISFCGRF